MTEPGGSLDAKRGGEASTLRERKCKSRAASPAPVAAKDPTSVTASIAEPKPSLSGFWEGFAGSVNGSFFKAPLWVDLQKLPGKTSQEPQVRNNPSFTSWFTGGFVFWSPNLVWLGIALFDYVVFPYNLAAAKTWSVRWIAHRLLANVVITFSYVGFWHVALYILGWGKRPFNPQRKYRRSKVIHNIFYNVLAVLQWTAWEGIFMHCYATGRLPYITDEESFGTLWGLALFVLTWFWVALWRDLHFYFAHRLLHVKFLYRYVHSLHHRNTDVEPFAGLCMHPVEHLLYFACAGPLLYVKASPFALAWFGVHLLLSPAASHSGFEDNFQSDQFHYAHHRFFECNYGTGGVPFDLWFGTFRESLDVQSRSYRGQHLESQGARLDPASAAQADAKATLAGLPRWDEALYNALTCAACPLLLVWALAAGPGPGPLPPLLGPRLLAAAAALGPLLAAAALVGATQRGALASPRVAFLYPFHRERWLGAFGLSVAVSLSVTALPVYHLVHMAASQPGEGVYYALYGGSAALG